MIDESESGEAYDKIAQQQPRLTPKRSPQRKRDPLDPSVEAKLVRAVMSKPTTANQLSRELGLKPAILLYHLKRLGLDRLVHADIDTTRLRRQRLKPDRRSIPRRIVSA